tara:strand:- start:534 stop:800 length:267 start_codon:yes stop_codon:yes gene_type:complete
MKNILKFPKKKRLFSNKFLDEVSPNAIGDYIKEQNPHLSIKAADAMALAIIYNTHLQLVFEEEGNQIDPSMEELDKYMWGTNDKGTLH